MRSDPLDHLQHLLQVIAFCLVIATVQFAFAPERPYGPPVVYSLLIGTLMWAVIDLGRGLFPSAAETGWPRGLAGWLLVPVAIVVGFVLGSWLGNRVCLYFGWFPAETLDTSSHWRQSLLITLLAGITGSAYFYARGHSAWMQRRMTESQRQASEARLKMLETQLEPHMLFNTLANLRALIGSDPALAQRMLDHMIAYLRATLAASRGTHHALQAEFDRLRDYLELMAVRMGPRLRFALALPPELAALPVPTLLLQPLVENAIRHGLEPQVAGGQIDVVARRAGDRLQIVVSDSGVGLDPDAALQPGFGLAQVRERLESAYGTRARIAWGARAGGGTEITLELPLP